VGQWLRNPDELYECVDGVPLVAMSNGQAKREAGHWLWESSGGARRHERRLFSWGTTS